MNKRSAESFVTSATAFFTSLTQVAHLWSSPQYCLLQEEPVAEKRFNPLEENDAADSAAAWKRYFQQAGDAEEFRRLVAKLNDAGRHAEIITALEAALRAGSAEPWMYETLALAMEIEKRPKDQIERVLLSMTDFNARDIPNLLGSAAYLVRLNAPEKALELYQQVARLQPTRPEPYLLSMKLADQTGDVDALIWACSGVLTYYWFDKHQQRHEEAIRLLSNWKLKLQTEGNQAEVVKIENALREAQKRDLKVKLTWSGPADLDLKVVEPLGTVCSFANRVTEGGGAMLHEGAGPEQKNCYEEYVCAYGAPGDYTVHVDHVDGKIVGNRARLEVTRYVGTDQEQTDVVNVLFNRRDKQFRISLNEGRRTEKEPVFVPVRESSLNKQKQARYTLLQLRNELSLPPQTFAQLRTSTPNSVGFSPVIAPVSSGGRLTATAQVSADRRYVRIGLQPVLTDVTDVFTFSFIGN